jgi:hypothetical protein
MSTFPVGTIVSVKVSEDILGIGKVRLVLQKHNYYFVDFFNLDYKEYSTRGYLESKVALAKTKEEYLLTNPEFFL